MNDAYEGSVVTKKIQALISKGQIPKIAFLDIDATITGTPESQQELRQTFEDRGVILIFVTARTSELCISWKERELSPDMTKKRLPALFLHEGGKMVALDPSTLPSFKGILDPDVVAATNGSEMLIRQLLGGYVYDGEYYEGMDESEDVWRRRILQGLTDHMKSWKTATMSPAEATTSYKEGHSGVSEPPYRIEIDFTDLDEKEDCIQKITSAHSDVVCTDESDETATPPLYKLYLMPARLSKRHAVDHIITQIKKKFPEVESTLEIVIAGDAYADLDMGLYGGGTTKATFLIPGGAKISRHMAEKKVIRKSMLHRDTLRPSDIPGFYQYGTESRTVIVGDEAYPSTKGADTVLAYLKLH